MKYLCAAIAIAGVLAGAPADFTYEARLATHTPRHAQGPSISELRQKAGHSSGVASRAAPAVVRVLAYRETPTYTIRNSGDYEIFEYAGVIREDISFGTGFFVTPDGFLVTNRHVVEGASLFAIDTGEKEIPVKVIYRDPLHDLAVLKADGENFPTLALSDSALAVGDSVTVVGNALGIEVDSVSTGSISAFGKSILVKEEGREDKEMDGLIEMSARLYSGDSGGPLLDDEGRVVGVNVAVALDAHASFSIPVRVLRTVLEKLGLDG